MATALHEDFSICGEIAQDRVQQLFAYLLWRSCAQTEEFSHWLNGNGRTVQASRQ
jgi:hypothetical protein